MVSTTSATAAAAAAAGSPTVGDGTPMLTAANCWDSVEFDTYWEAVFAEYYNQTHDDFACLDCGWYLDVILENYNNGWAPFQAVDDILNAEPSDADMMSAFGTKWHDGL